MQTFCSFYSAMMRSSPPHSRKKYSHRLLLSQEYKLLFGGKHYFGNLIMQYLTSCYTHDWFDNDHLLSTCSVLSNNFFSGPIPKELSALAMLEILDLSNNNLSGEVPQEIAEMQSLKHLYVF